MPALSRSLRSLGVSVQQLRRLLALFLASLLATIGIAIAAEINLAAPPMTEPVIPEAPEQVNDSTLPSLETTQDAETPPDPETVKRQQLLIEADRLYLGGQFAAAEKLYREAKPPFSQEGEAQARDRREPILDPEQLSPGGRVYWREAAAGIEKKLETRILVPLRLLAEQHPHFVPGHIRLAQALQDYGRMEEALVVLEKATTLYPNQPDLLRARVETLAKAGEWLDASIAARQFAILNANDPAAPEFTQLADQNLERFQNNLRERLTGNAIANILTGALGYALTGSLFGPFSALETTTMLLQGETAIGERVAGSAKNVLEMTEDPDLLAYVNELGQKLATVTGRNEFRYEFYVVHDDKINAFALPGGKIFINMGAIANTNSEAELVGLLAHEMAHAVLSHGFQLVAEGNLLANFTQALPFGGTLTNLFVANYSRDMERQADVLGTRMLVATGYAADGLRNLMVTMKKEDKPVFLAWFASHPGTDERIQYLETLIQRNRYNRYAYEGVERHLGMQKQAKKLLQENPPRRRR